jgi:hypothetical protein
MASRSLACARSRAASAPDSIALRLSFLGLCPWRRTGLAVRPCGEPERRVMARDLVLRALMGWVTAKWPQSVPDRLGQADLNRSPRSSYRTTNSSEHGRRAAKALGVARAVFAGIRGCSWGLGPQRDRKGSRNGLQEDHSLARGAARAWSTPAFRGRSGTGLPQHP